MPRLTAAILIAGCSATAAAQCPDGSPPPCRTQTVAAATPRRVNPPLDDRTWIVVPFDNLRKVAEIDWLRGASVNLLYLDMSRWRDIRVIDDERVADLLREVPEARDTEKLDLNAGLAIAKRAGAGRLVMGDLLQLGNRTAVTAKVYDVRSGQRLRSVQEAATAQDSVMPMFGKLARKILNVAPPPGAQVGALGTSSVDAYQAYVAGLEAMNRFDLQEARQHLEAAIRLDSAFALAHYKMSIVIGWIDPNDPRRRTHAEAAARSQAGLPARERTLIGGVLWQSTNDWTKACDVYSGLISADSTDVEAWYGRGECLFHDNSVEAVGGDTTKMRFRGDWEGSVRAFEQVLQLDPTYHLAYQHIIDVLSVDRRNPGCYRTEPNARCALFGAFLIRSGDSLLAVPVLLSDTAKLRMQAEQYGQKQSRRRNLDRAHAAAFAWVRAAPSEPHAHRSLARVLVLQGRVREADAEMAQIKGRGTLNEELRRILERMEIAYKLGRANDAIRIYDSVRTASIPLPGAPFHFGNAIAGYGPAFGRLAEFDSLLAVNARSQSLPENLLRYAVMSVRGGLTGLASDSMITLERAVLDEMSATRGITVATRLLAPGLMFTLRASRTSWPAVDTLRDPRFRPVVALVRRDTTQLRTSARALDSMVAQAVVTAGADSGFAVIAADAYLILGDSASALRVLRLTLDSATATPYFPAISVQGPPVYYAPRAMLLRADLAAALGYRDEARMWYKRFSDLWFTAALELQPLVERARKAHIALGGT